MGWSLLNSSKELGTYYQWMMGGWQVFVAFSVELGGQWSVPFGNAGWLLVVGCWLLEPTILKERH
jgi:hypothetical protein